MEGCRWEGQNLQLKDVQRLMKKNVILLNEWVITNHKLEGKRSGCVLIYCTNRQKGSVMTDCVLHSIQNIKHCI